jgi:hypothetical protein
MTIVMATLGGAPTFEAMILNRSKRPAAELDVASFFATCHTRIRDFTDIAARLGDVPNLSAEKIPQAARSLHWFFSVALPLHAEDEDRSVAPRLLARGISQEVEDALVLQATQHPVIDEISEGIAQSLRGVTDAVTLAPVAARVAALADGLNALWGVHLELEERIIFPAIQCLPRGDVEAILAECHARRSAQPMLLPTTCFARSA